MAAIPTIHALVGISRLAEMTGSTARALRHYEDAGLVRPYRTAAGVRQFTPTQCDHVAMIVRLRRCDLPLDVIHAPDGDLLGRREANTSSNRAE